MSIAAMLLGLALLLLTLAYILRPLFAPAWAAAPPGQRDQLLTQRAASYAAIQELDFEYQTGKLDQQDYTAQRLKYVLEGIQALKNLDHLPADAKSAQLADEVEAAVRAARQSRASNSRRCPQCQRSIDPGAHFCKCGAPLKSEADS